MYPGLVSISFRGHQPEEIVAAASAAGLSAIEWGGDLHVPPGRLGTARQVAQMTVDAGLYVAAYGSYYSAGATGKQNAFETVLETASMLNAPVVRVWAGKVGSRTISRDDRALTMRDLARCAELGAQAGIIVATEFHDGTLNDTAESARAFLGEIDHPHLRTYWQPPRGVPATVALEGLRMMSPWIEHLHVFHRSDNHDHRLLLCEGRERWSTFFREIALGHNRCAAMLEFMPRDSLAELSAEAATLLELLRANEAPNKQR